MYHEIWKQDPFGLNDNDALHIQAEKSVSPSMYAKVCAYKTASLSKFRKDLDNNKTKTRKYVVQCLKEKFENYSIQAKGAKKEAIDKYTVKWEYLAGGFENCFLTADVDFVDLQSTLSPLAVSLLEYADDSFLKLADCDMILYGCYHAVSILRLGIGSESIGINCVALLLSHLTQAIGKLGKNRAAIMRNNIRANLSTLIAGSCDDDDED